MDAIKTLKTIEAEERTATPEEQEILSKYVGWGGLKNAFEDFENYEDVESYYITRIFGERRADEFFKMLNEDALVECGMNSEGSDKIHLIEFK